MCQSASETIYAASVLEPLEMMVQRRNFIYIKPKKPSLYSSQSKQRKCYKSFTHQLYLEYLESSIFRFTESCPP